MKGENRTQNEVGLELLEALERARGRLAIAMAFEAKTTPAERWRDYRETEERMRRALKELRVRARAGSPASPAWSEALDALRRLPGAAVPARQAAAAELTERLRAALAPLERSRAERLDSRP